jgi:hypothetical protein
MTKQRHIKTFEEKYGNMASKLKEANDYYDAHYKDVDMDFEDIFNGMPYIGICYTPVTSEFNDWWHDCDDATIEHLNLNKIKILQLDDYGYCHYVTYDSHHRRCVFRYTRHNDYLLEGNVIIKKKYV